MRAVFVDGKNLSFMREPLGIQKFEHQALYDLLTGSDFGATAPLISKPVYTTDLAGEKGIGKAFRNIGFEVVASDEKDADDRMIIERINNLNPAGVTEIVILSADQDFIEPLRRHASAGVKVFWVATKREGRRGSMVSSLISESNEFHFVELSDFKDRIMREPWEKRELRPQENGAKTTEHKFVKVTLSTTAPHDEVADVLREVLKVIAKFPSIKYTIEG